MTESVLLVTTNSEAKREVYNEKRKESTFKGEYLIPTRSKHKQAIADLIEAGHCYERTTKKSTSS